MFIEALLKMIGLGRKPLNRFAQILDDSAGPSPWYLQPYKHRIETRNGLLTWKHLGNKEPGVGKILLKAGEKPLAVFNMDNWILLLNHKHLVVWNQKYVQGGPTSPVTLYVFDCDSLQPITVNDEVYEKMIRENIDIVFSDGLLSKIIIQTDDIDGVHVLQCPEALKQLDELLLLAHSSGIKAASNESDCCIISLKPKAGTYEIIPQDWFNKGNYDFGYEWIPRVNRDSETGNIICDGIRMGRYMLDGSGRKVLKRI